MHAHDVIVSTRSGSSVAATALGLGLTLIMTASAHAADGMEVKSPRQLPLMQDIKTEAPAVVKQDGGAEKAAVDHVAVDGDHSAPKVVLPPALANIQPLSHGLLWDQPGDGTLWARGAGYKASFGPEGFTYIPYMGSTAERNFPVNFTVQQVKAGTRGMSVLKNAGAVREGNRVSFDRGGFTEVYEVSADSIEQLFVFDALPASGDLVVRMNIATELGKSDAGDRLMFANARGSVGYSKAIALDAAGASIDAPTTLNNGVIEIKVPAAFIASAQFPLTIDPVITTFDAATDPADATIADIAYDATTQKYMVVWEEQFSAVDGDIYTRTYSAAGVPDAELSPIDTGSTNWRNPSCANNNIANQFLVVAQVGQAGSRIIQGRTRDAGSDNVSGVITINGGETGDKINPVVGGDPHTLGPTYYCVAWQRPLSANDSDVHARLVTTGGTLHGPDTIFLSNTGGTVDINPAISKSNGAPPAFGQAWTIVWERSFSADDDDIFGAQLAWDGAVITPVFPVDTTGTDDHKPAVSTVLDLPANGPRPFMVTYEETLPGFANDIYARAFTGSTQVAGGNLTNIQGVLRVRDQITPVVDTNGQKFIVAHAEQYLESATDYDIFISTFCLSGGSFVAAENRRVLTYTLEMDDTPAIATVHSAGGTGSAVGGVWHHQFAAGNGNIEAAAYTAPSTCGCSADVTATFGVVNVDDLLMVINSWGSTSLNEEADVNGDLAVNVDDLLAVINQWGPCPQ